MYPVYITPLLDLLIKLLWSRCCHNPIACGDFSLIYLATYNATISFESGWGNCPNLHHRGYANSVCMCVCAVCLCVYVCVYVGSSLIYHVYKTGVSGVIGSAVFNIMFVISVCALCAGTVSHLNWWPLCRDCFFYAISILVMLCTIANGYVSW